MLMRRNVVCLYIRYKDNALKDTMVVGPQRRPCYVKNGRIYTGIARAALAFHGIPAVLRCEDVATIKLLRV